MPAAKWPQNTNHYADLEIKPTWIDQILVQPKTEKNQFNHALAGSLSNAVKHGFDQEICLQWELSYLAKFFSFYYIYQLGIFL